MYSSGAHGREELNEESAAQPDGRGPQVLQGLVPIRRRLAERCSYVQPIENSDAVFVGEPNQGLQTMKNELTDITKGTTMRPSLSEMWYSPFATGRLISAVLHASKNSVLKVSMHRPVVTRNKTQDQRELH